VIAPVNRKPILLVNVIRLLTAGEKSFLPDIRGYGRSYDEPSFASDLFGGILKVMTELGLKSGKIGIEYDSLTVKHYFRLSEILPNATFVDVTSKVHGLRLIEDPDEFANVPIAAEFATAGLTAMPLQGIRVLETGATPAARLAGVLLADQGADVFSLDHGRLSNGGLDDYLDRGKLLLPAAVLSSVEGIDIIIAGSEPSARSVESQISLSFPAVAPGDVEFDLPPDASDDLLNALVGFYTDLGVTSKLLGRSVTYTPLPLCTVYAAVLGAVASMAALTDRERCGVGRDIVIPRLAAGLSAVGVLALDLEGVEPYLLPPGLLTLPPELMAEVPKVRSDESHMIWLVNRLNPTAGCYRSADGRLLTPVTTVNRRLAIRMFEPLGLYEHVKEMGIVDASPYDPASELVADRNIAVPQGMRNDLNIKLATLMEKAFSTKSAVEWEELFAEAQVPCAIVQDFPEWMGSSWARESGLVEEIAGLDLPQLGRSASVQSAQPYPPLQPGRRLAAAAAATAATAAAMAAAAAATAATAAAMAAATTTSSKVQQHQSGAASAKPLVGYVVADLANVIAGPACGRLLAELGATVYKIDTTRPDHQPLVTIIWAGDVGQGKKSILVDLRTPAGREVLERLVAKADIVVMNATDSGTERLGLSRAQLANINPRAIGIQVSAFKGERRSSHDDRPGYDPLLQAATGIMSRFGTKDMPLLHGIASCVDYLTGYLGAFAALVGLQARERRGDQKGDWTETSLARGAALVQFPFQAGPGAATANGPSAIGPSVTARLHQLTDGWVFAEATDDLSEAMQGLTAKEATEFLRERGALVVPVLTIAALKQKYMDKPSETVRFRRTKCDGLETTALEPTWFRFNGQNLAPVAAAVPPGSSYTEVLLSLGFTSAEIQTMLTEKIIGQPNWRHLAEN
jgi:crotonobetainyl-CoA:carnitine CoA-transferase CaiB-like acyl-CoA transferase